MGFRTRLVALLSLLPFTLLPTYAQKELTLEQKTKIIEKLPSQTMSWQAQFSFNSDGLSLSTEQSDAPTRLAKLLRKPVPKEPIPHAEHLLNLAKAYFDAGSPDSGVKAAREAEAILQQRKPSATDAKDKVFRLFANARWYQNDAIGAEKFARDAVRLQPKSWLAWQDLSSRLYVRSWSELFEGPSTKIDDITTALMHLGKDVVPAEKRARSEKAFTEADACLAKAEALAPQEPTIILTRMVRGLYVIVRDAATQKATGKSYDANAAMKNALLGPEIISLMAKLAEVQSDDPLAVGGYAFFRMARVSMDKGGNGADRYSAEDRKFLADTMAHLEKIGSDTKRDALARGRAWESAGIISAGFLEDYKASDRYFREERKVDADRSGGWMGGVACAGSLKNFDEEYELAQGYVNRWNTDYTRLLVAKGAIDSGHLREAEQSLRAMRDKDPGNVKVNLALGIALVKQSGDDPSRLTEVGTLIKALQEKTGNHFEGDEYLDLSMLAAAMVALSGNVQNGIDILEAANKQDPSNEKLNALLAVLEGTK